ncbi:hypothetical protein [Leptolinea tardivitalis]|uniref:Transglycosylase n=1 Tax=Leptolinea tardivitalis TaxID=229920 RepID=A0A0P6XC47_9CHLR|nr:hypothetical protein [Leptolinea tardivitalis]KPL72403.1 hypothetical protein ADM99_08245 [Leptolinea tardivitalis]GAP22760.1 hypothetical protein LTAR_03001 [Leptolinea tardivitalis]
MTLPAFLFGVLVSTCLGAVFHLWKGGSFTTLLLDLLVSWLGFWLGHFAGVSAGLAIGTVGPLRLGSAIVGGIIFLSLGYWLFQEEPAKK